MALATPRNFTIQNVFELLLRHPGDKHIIAYLSNTKTSGLENTMEMVYPTGGQGNVYIGGGFMHSRRATLNVTVATFNTDVLATQNSTEVVTGNTLITEYDIIEPVNGNYFTKFVAQGAAGSELSFVYTIGADGGYIDTFTQAAVPGPGTFSYSTSDKRITFGPDGPTDGTTRIATAYSFLSADNAKRMKIVSDGIPPTVLATAYGVVRDICTGDLFRCQLEGQAQVDGNWTWDLSADGDPATQSFSMEFVKGCLDKTLYDIIIYTDDEDEPRAAMPVATPPGGNYSSSQSVTLTTTTAGATIYYTDDGTTPTTASTQYSGAITIPASTTTDLKAIATATGYEDSAIMSETYVIS